MASLIGKALATRGSGPPVPLGGDGMRVLPGMVNTVNVEQALMRAYNSNGTVNSNVSLLASSVAGPKWKLFRKQPQDGRQRYTTSDKGSDQRTEIIQHAALNVLNTPAVIDVDGIQVQVFTRFRLFELSGIWLETTGKSHWVVDHAEGNPLPLGLWPVRPDRMLPVPSRDRYLAGWIYTSPDGMSKVPLLPTEVIFNCYPDPMDPYGGSGPIRSVLTDIEAASYAAEFNRNYFINSAEPNGIIQVDHELTDPQFNELVDRWREAHRGVARAHRVAVLEAGQTWVPNSHTMRDMDFALLRGTSRDIIREALGMHKVMTGVTDDVNRANAQTGEEVFASWKVDPRLGRWRDCLNSQLLPLFGATGKDAEYDYIYPMPQNREQDALELKTKTEAFLTLVTAGVDPDAAAEVVGLPAMKVAERASQAPALPPGWVAAPQPALPPGGDGAAAPAGVPAQGALDIGEVLRARAGWDSPAWKALAAFNRAGAVR
ncbi:MAG TPA: phage portal protein [Streptosporangiaceae bacterium]|nr:phage portal protein [Streptosporangiaceae bacterium]